jgi:hypothetical protein
MSLLGMSRLDLHLEPRGEQHDGFIICTLRPIYSSGLAIVSCLLSGEAAPVSQF